MRDPPFPTAPVLPAAKGLGSRASSWRWDAWVDFRISRVTAQDPGRDRGLLCCWCDLSFFRPMLNVLLDQKPPPGQGRTGTPKLLSSSGLCGTQLQCLHPESSF